MKNKLNRLTHKVLKLLLLQMEVFHQIKKKKILLKHMWRKDGQRERDSKTHLRSQLFAKSPRSVTRTWGKGQNILSPHTQSPRESRGVNPVSGKPGLTLVNPTATAEATAQNEIPRTSLAHVHVHNYFDSYAERNTCRQTYIVWPQSGGFRCVICSPFPTFAQLCLWSGSNVDSCRPVT